ncbi:LPO_1073/Vpar_1526 family protein [Nocardioides sp. NPDC000445]|uniref:LPO_1073/Vpar_1526 family protein n=1 Tax=Nocardioides sp. NPDC000445 TaxID=3154257 RepID=UPI003329E760
MSYDEVKTIALDVFRANFLELQGVAEEVAIGRAEKMTSEFLSRLAAEAPGATANFSDPDVQRTVYAAQREFACSGEEELGQVLIDLLVDRVQQEDRNLRALALNEAILAAPKLTERQRCAIGVVFLLRYARMAVIADASSIIETRFRGALLKLPSIEGLREMDLQHLEYVGVGAVSMGKMSLGELLLWTQTCAFTRGFAEDEMPDALRNFESRDRLVMDSYRDPARFQLAVAADEDVDKLLSTVQEQDVRDAITSVRAIGRLSADEVKSEVLAHTPDAATLIDVWESTSLKKLTLTSVGIALGHTYWRRFGGEEPLSDWL